MRLGVLFTIVGSVWMYFASNMFQLAFVPFLFACGFSLSTSSFGAIVYDTLLSHGKEDTYPKVIGSINAIGRLSLAVSAICSGFLYNYHVDAPALVQIVNMVFYAVFAWRICEPTRQKNETEQSHLKVIGQTIKFVLFKHVDLKWVIVILCVLAVANTKAYWVIQPLVADISTSSVYVGFAAACTFTLSAIASYLTHKIELLVSEKKLLLFAAVCSFCGYGFAGLTTGLLMPIMLGSVFIAFGVAQIVTQTMINERVTSDIRATTLSITSSANGLLFSLVTPIFGWAINVVDMTTALFSMGVFIALSTLTAWFCIKNK